MIVLKSGERFDVHSELSNQEELERAFAACRELMAWLEGKGFDLEGLLEEDEEFVDNALWLYYLLEDVLRGDCKLVDTWTGGEKARVKTRRRCTLSVRTVTLRVTWRVIGEWR